MVNMELKSHNWAIANVQIITSSPILHLLTPHPPAVDFLPAPFPMRTPRKAARQIRWGYMVIGYGATVENETSMSLACFTVSWETNTKCQIIAREASQTTDIRLGKSLAYERRTMSEYFTTKAAMVHERTREGISLHGEPLSHGRSALKTAFCQLSSKKEIDKHEHKASRTTHV